MNKKNKKIEINIGTICNNDCLFCMSGGANQAKRNFIDFAVICQELKKYREKGYDSVGFLGGEITIYPQVLELINYTKNLGYKNIHIISNARKFSELDFLESLIDHGVTRISVSVHSHKKEIENFLNNRNSYIEQILGVKNLIQLYNSNKLKEEVPINIVINKLNYKTLAETIKFFYDLGIREFRLNFIWPEGNALINKDKLLLKYNDFKPYLKKWYLLSKILKINLALESVPFCIIENKKIINNLYGEFRDGQVDVVAGKERNFFNWQKQKKDIFKTKTKKCLQCIYFNQCDGVWKNYIKIYGWDEFMPIKE